MGATSRGDAADCWRLLLLGEIVRALGGRCRVRDEGPCALGRSGRWQTGLARLGPALTDALGATAFAVAWRRACAQAGRRAWPGARLVAEQALEAGAEAAELENGEVARIEQAAGTARVFDDGREGLERTWTLRTEDGRTARIGLAGAGATDWSEVDRIADVAAAWLGGAWEAR